MQKSEILFIFSSSPSYSLKNEKKKAWSQHSIADWFSLMSCAPMMQRLFIIRSLLTAIVKDSIRVFFLLISKSKNSSCRAVFSLVGWFRQPQFMWVSKSSYEHIVIVRRSPFFHMVWKSNSPTVSTIAFICSKLDCSIRQTVKVGSDNFVFRSSHKHWLYRAALFVFLVDCEYLSLLKKFTSTLVWLHVHINTLILKWGPSWW